MKLNFFYSVFITMSVFALASCSDDSEKVLPDDFEPIGDVLTISRSFVVEGATRALDKECVLTASFDVRTDKIVDYKIQQVEDGILKDMEISQVELDQALIAELGPNFTDLAALEDAKEMASGDFTLPSCLQDCRDKYTDADGHKIHGRGACRFACWFERVMLFFERVGKIFS